MEICCGAALWVVTPMDKVCSSYVNEAGAVFLTGAFGGTADFDPSSSLNEATAVGEQDIFIEKINTAGEMEWLRHMGSPLDDSGRSITVDDEENIYIAGNYQGVIDFDSSDDDEIISSSGNDVFILKIGFCTALQADKENLDEITSECAC